MTGIEHFQPTFDDCRQSFLEIARSTGGELRSHSVPSQSESGLSFETLYLPPTSGTKKKLLVLTSGIHGIEGYTGSALQRHFLSSDLFEKRDPHLGILIIHGINPYGFKHFRRVTENNVDLNRNFDVTTELFKTVNPEYEKLNTFLNPESRYSRLLFYPKAMALILRHGMEKLRRAILQGQYKNSQGIFFGGINFEPQVSLIRDELLRVTEGYEKVLLVDLHTGHGQRGKLHLFGDRSPFIDPDYMQEVFDGMAIDFGQAKDFYSVTGGFTVFVARLLHGKTKFAGIVFEFGTIDSQKPKGALESLYRMINENQKTKSPGDKEDFLEMFYPRDAEWRKEVLQQFQANLKKILGQF
jgi:hypothetical protein